MGTSGQLLSVYSSSYQPFSQFCLLIISIYLGVNGFDIIVIVARWLPNLLFVGRVWMHPVAVIG